ncbi:MAG: recombinase RecT [Oscillospiraceae bacterium]|jgi:recombination protein RecT|nr:recombinase RecT [Oscillospiraceae bacterium]
MGTQELATQSKNISDTVLERVESLQKNGNIHFPPNYSPQNALKSAWLALQAVEDRNKKPALEVCTRDSIANALFDMVIQGLSPAKKQCYFIVYGDKLTTMRSYHGTKAVLKRMNGVQDVFAQVVHEGDEFVYEIDNAVISVVEHKQTLESLDRPIVGAYSVIIFDDDRKPFTELMSKKQIDVSWGKSKTGGSVAKEFPEEMAMRTVINRGAKRFVNASDDSDLIIEAFNNTEYVEVDAYEVSNAEISANANKKLIDASSVVGNDEYDEPDDEPEGASTTDAPPSDTQKSAPF